MIKKVEIQQGRRLVTAYEYTLFAFTTEKETFTLVGSDANGTDTFREIGTSNFYEWKREEVYDWFIKGKITPIEEALRIDWSNNTTISKTTRNTRLK